MVMFDENPTHGFGGEEFSRNTYIQKMASFVQVNLKAVIVVIKSSKMAPKIGCTVDSRYLELVGSLNISLTLHNKNIS